MFYLNHQDLRSDSSNRMLSPAGSGLKTEEEHLKIWKVAGLFCNNASTLLFLKVAIEQGWLFYLLFFNTQLFYEYKEYNPQKCPERDLNRWPLVWQAEMKTMPLPLEKKI